MIIWTMVLLVCIYKKSCKQLQLVPLHNLPTISLLFTLLVFNDYSSKIAGVHFKDVVLQLPKNLTDITKHLAIDVVTTNVNSFEGKGVHAACMALF